MIRVLIYAAGKGRRWGDYMNTKKQLVVIDGEVLLHRTVRQCHEFAECEIFLICPVGDDRFFHPDVVMVEKDVGENEIVSVDKCLNSRDLWNVHGRTVCVLGDVWFEDKDIRMALTLKAPTFVRYNREGLSMLTGKPWGEDHACSFYPQDHETVLNALNTYDYEKHHTPWTHVMQTFIARDGKIHRYETGGFTEDFDHPVELKRWFSMRDKHRGEMLQCGISQGV